LLAFDAGEAGVVSLYLNVDTTQQTPDTIKLQARTLMKEGEVQEKDVQAIEQYLDFSHTWGKPGLALFSCAEQDFFRAYPSAIVFRNRVRLGPKPHVKPLSHLLDYYATYGVIVVDKIGARFFEYHLGELQDSDGTTGEDVRKLKSGGGSSRGGSSSSTGQRGGQAGRGEEETILRNMRDTALAAQQFFSRKPIRRLFLGGTNENVALLRENLSKQLQSRIAGAFAVDMTAGEHEVRELSLELLEEANAERELELVKNMITTAAKGGNAVTGLPATLQTVSEGRAHILIISDGYRSPGYIDEETGFLSVYDDNSLSTGGGSLTQVTDIVEAAASRTMTLGGSVEIISDNQDLDKAGRIGALLRY
jgi:peptide subunit release factor 1 (eRF1)